jgi:hypothetical protein
MMSKFIKVIAIIFVIIIILSLIMVAAGLMTWTFFWIIALIAAFIAYIAIPWLRKRAGS